jgi:hypothetical protein
MAESGVFVDHATIHRWTVHYACTPFPSLRRICDGASFDNSQQQRLRSNAKVGHDQHGLAHSRNALDARSALISLTVMPLCTYSGVDASADFVSWRSPAVSNSVAAACAFRRCAFSPGVSRLCAAILTAAG